MNLSYEMSLNLKVQHRLRTTLTEESTDPDPSPEYLLQDYSLVATYVVDSTAKRSRPDMCVLCMGKVT